jgi:pilus assembly protein Flp/PilA
MKNLSNAFVKFLKNEDGPTAVEYAVMMALIIAVCFATITVVGTKTNNSLTYSNSRISGTGT